MKKINKITLLILIVVICLSLAAYSALGQEGTDKWKIGIMTNTVTQNEEEYRAAQNVLAKYGEEHVIHMTFPDKFMDEQETTIANLVSMASDPDLKVLIICQACPGTAPGIDSVKEIRDDLLIIVGQPQDDPPVISARADIVMQLDEMGMGVAIPAQAKAQGAKVFVHYSFPRHMSYPLLSARRDLMKSECARIGLEFVDATAPDPTGDAGIPGAQQYILEDVPRMVAKYGKDTALFSTNCSMQVPLISAVVETGAIYPQPCCPSPFHGFPSALNIGIPEDKKGDIDFVVAEITRIMAEKGMTGRTSTWPVPVSMMMIEGSAEYAKAWIDGETDGKMDIPKLSEKLFEYSGVKVNLNNLEEGGTFYDNYYTILIDFLNF
jgi:hypothetical protein